MTIPVPLPTMMPERVVEPVPPFATASVPAKEESERQLPPTAKHPAVRLIPLLAVVVAPLMERADPLLPIVVLPFWSIAKTVVVADAVEVEIERSGIALAEVPAIERRAKGDDVPIPKLPALLNTVIFTPDL